MPLVEDGTASLVDRRRLGANSCERRQMGRFLPAGGLRSGGLRLGYHDDTRSGLPWVYRSLEWRREVADA